MKGLLPVMILAAALVMAEGAIGQDPGMLDSLVFGNLDGSPIPVDLDVDFAVPIWLKCDENLAFINLSLATQNFYVTSRNDGIAMGPMTGWDLQFMPPADGWPQPGLTTQTFLGIADFTLPQPNYINTGFQWVLIGAFRGHTTADTSARGDYSQLFGGEDPTQGFTVLFDEFWNPIVPRTRFSSLHFQGGHPPTIVSPPDTTFIVNGLFPIKLPFIATDSDNDSLWLSVDAPISGDTLVGIERRAGYARSEYRWTPAQTLRAVYNANFIATDVHGSTDINRVIFDVRPIVLQVETDTVLPGFPSEITIRLKVEGGFSSVAGFNIVLTYDPSILTLQNVAYLDTVARWDYTYTTPNPLGPGSVRLIGVANLYTAGHPLMRGAEFQIARLTFSTLNDPGLGGMMLAFGMPAQDLSMNVVTDSSGYLVFHPVLIPGGVRFLSTGDYLVGDINLNGSPFEVGDAVTLAQYFVDPINNPLNPVQMAAADCNRDGIPATIADLIYLLGVINGSIPPPLGYSGPGIADMSLEITNGRAIVNLRAENPAGGVLLRIRHNGADISNIVAQPGLKILWADRDGLLSAIIYSETGRTPIDDRPLYFDFTGDAAGIHIETFEVSDIYGKLFDK